MLGIQAYYIKDSKLVAGEMPHWSRTLVAPKEDPSLDPSTHMVTHSNI